MIHDLAGLVVAVAGFACEKPEPVSAPPATSSSAGMTSGAGMTNPPSPEPPTSSSSQVPPSKGPIKTLFVKEALVDCEGEGPMKCMQVRESDKADWTLFYGKIEGFNYEESYRYEIRVEVTSRGNSPADSSSLRYRLVEVVSKKKVENGKSP